MPRLGDSNPNLHSDSVICKPLHHSLEMQVFISLHLRVRQSFLIYRVSWRLIPIPYFSTHGKSHRYFPFQLFEPFLVPKELKSTFSFTTSTNTICPSSTVRISTYLFSGHFPFLSIAHSFEIKIRSVLLHQMLQLVISLISLTFLILYRQFQHEYPNDIIAFLIRVYQQGFLP